MVLASSIPPEKYNNPKCGWGVAINTVLHTNVTINELILVNIYKCVL